MAPQPKAEEYAIDDQKMENYNDKLQVTAVNAEEFETMINDPLKSKSAIITNAII